MSDLRPRGIPIMLEDGVERHLLFTLNMIDEIQERYGKTLKEVMDDLTNPETMKPLIREMVTMLFNNEARRSEWMGQKQKTKITEVTAEEVGEMIGLDNIEEVMRAIFKAYGISLPEADEEEEEDPNQESGRQNS